MLMSRLLRAIPLLMGLALALPLAAGSARADPAVAAPPVQRPDGQHDFDFEFGDWTTHIRRLEHPLTGSTRWVEYDGPSIVRKVWGGLGNLGEIDVSGPAGRIQGLSLRLYDPQTRQWFIRFANSRDGDLGPPMIGGFKDGRGEFYNQETLNGRSIFVRFIFSGMTDRTFALEQAFSSDGGKTWEANWIATFKRV